MLEKLKVRLDTFSDGIFAILITIMVLELPVGLTETELNLPILFQAIGIYLVSFCFIGNLWYQHAMVFDEVKEVPNRVVVYDLILFFFVSLVPTFTRIMTNEVNSLTVFMYGILSTIISFLFSFIVKIIVKSKYHDKDELRKVYNSIFGNFRLKISFSFLIITPLAYFFPHIIVVFYLAIPIFSFFGNMRDTEEFNEVAETDTKVQSRFVDMSPADRRKFHSMLQNYKNSARQIGNDQQKQRELWGNFANGAAQEFGFSNEDFINLLNKRTRGFNPQRNQKVSRD